MAGGGFFSGAGADAFFFRGQALTAEGAHAAGVADAGHDEVDGTVFSAAEVPACSPLSLSLCVCSPIYLSLCLLSLSLFMFSLSLYMSPLSLSLSPPSLSIPSLSLRTVASFRDAGHDNEVDAPVFSAAELPAGAPLSSLSPLALSMSPKLTVKQPGPEVVRFRCLTINRLVDHQSAG